ncbi:hypothetical protein BT96DRAFT_1021567 [Gymnopus androsaceus JB14]|uniref:Uncharacterized protein n=1 Tax=Gymnopus androsaceus JB14 TaxID=1447944 RepID=A0A6A4HCH3_9AGAR|nr:hypothetical protein BT96DRAFT_1021567 [Gymnopus androsaceus JB14]
MTKSYQSNFNPLERREWQSTHDRRTHETCLDIFRRDWASYPEAQFRFRQAVENLQIAVERTELLYNSQKYPSFIRNYKFRKSYCEYEICLKRLVEETEIFARSCDEYEYEHPELFQRRHKLQAKRKADIESGHCKVDITVGESSVNIKVQGKGSVDVSVKRGHTKPPPPYIP